MPYKSYNVYINCFSALQINASYNKYVTLSHLRSKWYTVRIEIFEVYKFSWILWCVPYPRKLIHYK